MTNKLQVKLGAMLVEVAYLYPMYYMVALALQTPQTSHLSLGTFSIVALLTVLAQYFLLTRLWSQGLVWSMYLLVYLVLAGVLYQATFIAPFLTVPLLAKAQTANIFLFYGWVWLRSALITRKTLDYSRTVQRFELSMVILFVILLLVHWQSLTIPSLVLCMLLVLIGNLWLLSLTKPGHDKIKSWVVLAYFGSLLVPVLTVASLVKGTLYGFSNGLFVLAQPLFGAVLQGVAVVLKFLLGRSNMAPQRIATMDSSQPAQSAENIPLPENSAESGWLGDLLLYLVLMALALGALMVVVSLLRSLWLKLKKPQALQTSGLPKLQLLPYLAKLWLQIKKLWLALLAPTPHSIPHAYQHLLHWAAHKNQAKAPWETPYEHGQRLSAAFPQHQDLIQLITESYVQQRYGQRQPTLEELRTCKKLISKL